MTLKNCQCNVNEFTLILFNRRAHLNEITGWILFSKMSVTSDCASNLPCCLFTSLHRGLFTVPGCVWSTYQVGGILQRTCCKTVNKGKVITEISNELITHSKLSLVRLYHGYLKGSVSWTSRAAPRILPSFRAWAKAFSSTRPPLDVFTRKAPWRICIRVSKSIFKLWGTTEGCDFQSIAKYNRTDLNH